MAPSIKGFFHSQLFVTPPEPSVPFTGQTIIITGSNAGLGLASAKQVAGLNPAKLILAVRNLESGKAAKEKIEASYPKLGKDVIEIWKLDLSSFESVKSFAEKCNKSLTRLDGIALNAGIQTDQFKLAEGYETQVTVNVLSTFLLALLILPKLQETHNKFSVFPRLSITSSEVHDWAKFPERNTPKDKKVIEVLSDPKTTTMSERYMTSKLLEVLVFRHLRHNINIQKQGVVFTILNPGFCHSELARDTKGILLPMMKAVLARSQDMGGRPVTWGVTEGTEKDGKYMHDSVVGEDWLSSYVVSPEGEKMGERLWDECREVFERVAPGSTKGL